MVDEHGISQRQACKAVRLSSSTYRYKPKERNDEDVISELQELVDKHPAIGFWQAYYRLRRKGHIWNHKRVYRVYTSLKLNIRRRRKRRIPARVKQALYQPEQKNLVWSVDFMTDSLWNGRRFRLLNIVDDYSREILHIEADISLPTSRLIRSLEYLELVRGLPRMIRMDNGPEFISSELDVWSKQKGIELIFIQPGKPMQNGYVERCNGNIRRELLEAYICESMDDFREIAEQWRLDYNEDRPHTSLGYLPPAELEESRQNTQGK